jgi:hypothetical protein
MTIPNEWLRMVKDKQAFLEEIDPDWKDHFKGDADLALDFYTVMDPKKFLEVLKDTQ